MVTVYTIGVYGSDRSSFFGALENARRRVPRHPHAPRGTRSAVYVRERAAADRRASRARHRVPARSRAGSRLRLLALQHAADAQQGRRYSARTELSPEYLRRYRAEVLNPFDFDALAHDLDGFKAPVCFCIERVPEACHRSLVAPKLARALGTEDCVHLIPEAATTIHPSTSSG